MSLIKPPSSKSIPGVDSFFLSFPGTLLSFPLAQEKTSKFGWTMRVKTDDEISYNLTFIPSAEAIIGLYEIVTQISSESEAKSSKVKEKFYLIFNPWCKQDMVYMEGNLF